MAKAAAKIWRASHLPEQPAGDLGALCRVGWQQLAKLLGQILQDRAGLKNADRRRAAAIEQRRDLRVRVHADKTAGELIAVADFDEPSIILSACVPERQKLLEHDRDLHAVWRRQRIELQRMLANGQVFVMRRARNRAIDVGEPAAAFCVPGPDLGGDVG